MPVMTLIKTWEHEPNIPVNTGVDEQASNAELLWSIKDRLVNGAFTIPAVVRGSSDSLVADASDNWGSPGDLVWQTDSQPRSWIILRLPGILPTFDLKLECERRLAVTQRQITLAVCPNGYNIGSGTTSSPPAPTVPGDEVELMDGGDASADNFLATGAAGAFVASLNVSMSSDGECVRIWAMIAGIGRLHWFFEKPRVPKAYWTNSWIALARGRSAGLEVTSYDLLLYAQHVFARVGDGLNPAVSISMLSGTCESGSDGGGGVLPIPQILTGGDSVDNASALSSMGLSSPTPGTRFRPGMRFDCAFGEPGLHVHYPDVGPIELAHIGDIVYPYPNTPMSVT